MYETRLSELRNSRKLKQDELAKDIGIARITYSHYESCERIIPIKRLNDISNYYGISIDYILKNTNIKSYKNESNTINKKLSSIRLKEFRKDNNLSQTKLAKELNTTTSTISGYEICTNIIPTSFLYTICKKYNISADYLLGKTDSPKYFK